jgi:hypothetical protein
MGTRSVEFAGTERFAVVRRLGAGGMGVVYEAWDHERGAKVALKTLPALDDAEALLRFKREFRALQDLTHPNLVHLGELFHERGRWFFSMELIEGVDFVAWVRPHEARTALAHTLTSEGAIDLDPTARDPQLRAPREGTCDLARLRPALAQLAEGLQALHAAGKIHRDVKPSNLLVTRAGRVVLLDFGVVGELSVEENAVVGTVAYMAPEQAVGAAPTPAADWYAVGVLLYEALTGRLPFVGTPSQLLGLKQRGAAPPPSQLVAAIPDDLDALCFALLDPDPARRPDGTAVLPLLGASAPAARASASTPLVGRSRETAELHAAFATTQSGRAVSVIVEGESGVGKTTLIGGFTAALREAGALVLSGRCHERELVPFRALDGIVDALSHFLAGLTPDELGALLPDEIALLACAFPVLRRLPAVAAAPLPEIVNPQELRLRTFAQLRELFKRLAALRRLVLVIDDLQWADADSLALLEEVLRLPGPPALLLVCAVRPVAARASAAAALPGEVRHLSLARLSADDAVALAQSLLGESARDSAQAIADEAGGHPLFIDELVRHAGGGARAQPLGLEELLWQRLDTLDAADRNLVVAVAAAGAPIAQGAAAQAAGLPSNELVQRTDSLRAQHLLRSTGARARDRIDVFHDRVREAVLRRLDQEARRAQHRRLAEALEATDADAEALCLQWQGAGEPARAARYALDAAKQANAQLAFQRAAELYQLALELGADGERGEVEARRGEALASAGLGAQAARAFLAAASQADPERALVWRRRAGEQYLATGHVDEGMAVLRPLCAELGIEVAASTRRAVARFLVERARLRLRGLGFRARPAAEVPPRALERIDLCWTAAMGLAAVDSALGAEFQARHLRLALEAGEPYRVCRALAAEAGYLGLRSATRERALEQLGRAAKLARELGDPRALALVTGIEGLIAHLSGDWVRAVSLCTEAERAFRERCVGATWELDTMQLFAMYALTYLGEFGELERLLPARLREARERGDRYAEINLRIRVGHVVALAADDPARARNETRASLEEWSRLGFQHPHLFALFAEANVDLYEGDGGAAHRRLEASWPKVIRSPMMRVDSLAWTAHNLRARAALACAAVEKQHAQEERLLAIVERSARALERLRYPHGPLSAELLDAVLRFARGDREAADQMLEHVARACDEAGLRTFAALFRRRRAELIGGEAGRARVAAADAVLEQAGVKNPARLANAYMPWFSREA